MNRPFAGCVWSCALLCAALWGGSREVWADDAVPAAADELIVMTDGRILRGRVSRHAVGFYIERSGGTILVPKEQVRCIAHDLPEAYRLQREQMLDPTSAMLIQLAEWCISYRLYEEAGQELKRALRRDPQNETARRMLAKLEDRLLAAPQGSANKPKFDVLGMAVADVESLGGLSKETAEEFTTRIQPLLINKCGNGSCHGFGSTTDFRLAHVRIGSANHRRSSEQNLALALKLITIDTPASSPLLQRSQGAHGGASLAIFGGAGGADQYQTLETWVDTVCAERQAEAAKIAGRTPLKTPRTATSSPMPNPPTMIQTTALEQPAEPEVLSSPVLANAQYLAAQNSDRDALPSSESPPTRQPRSQDAFDPEEFNAQFGGQPVSRNRR
ncbi:hypothetical protein GC163_20975 [bacterium]|nr:hypothetical protein [bacterium]